MSFLIILTIFFVSPLYFAIRGKWLAFAFNSICYLIAVVCLLSLVGAIIAPFFWIFGVAHAMWHFRRDVMEENATILARKMAAAVRQGGA
jgi:hypothetical protein